MDDETKDPTYEPPKLTPRKRGMRIEYLIGQTKSHCCGAILRAERVNNPVTDFRCQKCDRGIQVKSTTQWSEPNYVVVTRASEKNTCDNPITFYKVLIKDDELYMKIFSPRKDQQVYYRKVKLNRWKQPVLSLGNGRITKLKKLNLDKSWI